MASHWSKPLVGITSILLLASCGNSIARNEYSETQVVETVIALFPTQQDDNNSSDELPKFSEEILDSQKEWEASKISDYHVIISFSDSLDENNKRTEREVMVENGNVIKSSCLMNQCPTTAFFEAIYTIEDLFEVAKGSTLDKLSFPGYFTPEYNDCVQELSFDVINKFPKSMNIDCPGLDGDEHSFQVILFEAFK
jgi:hypothetical protein